MRSAARALLACLPGSAFAERMRTRVMSLELEVGKDGWSVIALPAVDDMAPGDGSPLHPGSVSGVGRVVFDGDRRWLFARWLQWIAAAAPLDAWEQLLPGLSPEEIVAGAGGGPGTYEATLRSRWLLAAVRQSDHMWAEACLPVPTEGAPDALDPVLLPPDRAVATVAHLLRSGAGMQPQIAELVGHVPGPWPAEFSKLVLDGLSASFEPSQRDLMTHTSPLGVPKLHLDTGFAARVGQHVDLSLMAHAERLFRSLSSSRAASDLVEAQQATLTRTVLDVLVWRRELRNAVVDVPQRSLGRFCEL